MSVEQLEVIRILSDLGGTLLLAVLTLYYGYRFFSRVGHAFISSHEKIANAMEAQAKSMDGLRDAVHTVVNRENTDHREILLALEVISDQLNGIRRRERDERENV